MSVIVLIPAHDEAANIAATVEASRRIAAVDRVVVIDDGSTDPTCEVAREAGAEVICFETNQGKGTALDAGRDRVRDEADTVLLLDADLGESASQGAALLEPILAGRADMTIATFPPPQGKAGFGLVKGLARTGIRALGGKAGREFPAAAPLSGQRALNRTAFEMTTPFAFGYGVEVALTVRALRAGLRVLEVPTTMTHDATGRNVAGFKHRGRQFAHVARALTRLALEPPRARR